MPKSNHFPTDPRFPAFRAQVEADYGSALPDDAFFAGEQMPHEPYHHETALAFRMFAAGWKAALQQAGEPVAWRPIETAPKGPGRSNPINDFLPENLGPLLLMSIPFTPEPATTVGFWCPEHECWRHLADDGPHDIEPTHWKPLPLPQQTALVEGQSPELDEINGRLA